MARHVGVPFPTGIPVWGVNEEKLTQACCNTADADPPTVVERVSMKAKKSGKRAKTPSNGIVRNTLAAGRSKSLTAVWCLLPLNR